MTPSKLNSLLTTTVGTALLGLALSSTASAQSPPPLTASGNEVTVSYNGSYQDFTIPAGIDALELTARGGEGGDATAGACTAYGGRGARARAVFPVGTGTDELEPGGILRFIVGDDGESPSLPFASGAAGVGGGGTGILYLPPGAVDTPANWQHLLVGGGGGGAHAGVILFGLCVDMFDGGDASFTTCGGDGAAALSGTNPGGCWGNDGTDGTGSGSSGQGGGMGGHGFVSASNVGSQPSMKVGSAWPWEYGSFGFGGGGTGGYNLSLSGGGGGYSGGGGGDTSLQGGGGGSYVDWRAYVLPQDTFFDYTGSTGYAAYKSIGLPSNCAYPFWHDGIGADSMELEFYGASKELWFAIDGTASTCDELFSWHIDDANDVLDVEIFSSCGASIPYATFTDASFGLFWIPAGQIAYMRLTPATTLDGTSSDTFRENITVTPISTGSMNDTPASAMSLGSGTSLTGPSFTANLNCATDSGLGSSTETIPASQDVWFTYTNTSAETLTFYLGWKIPALSGAQVAVEVQDVWGATLNYWVQTDPGDGTAATGGHSMVLAPGATRLVRVAQDVTQPVGTIDVDMSVLPYYSWTNLGFQLDGAVYKPGLTASGSLDAGTPFQVDLIGAPPSTGCVLVIGNSQAALPLFGGTLVPTPDILMPMVTDANGEASLSMPWLTGVAPSTSGYWQYWVFDATGPQGFTASNAMMSTTPPL